MVANLLARSAGLANEIPSEVEEMLGAQMVAEARIIAHFVDAAEKAGFTPEEINRRLRQIADTTVLDEFWITDEKGHAYLRNIDVGFHLQSLTARAAAGTRVLAAAHRQEG